MFLCTASHRFLSIAHTHVGMTWETGSDFLFRLVQASTDISSLQRLVGKGIGSIVVEAILWEFWLLCSAPIDAR